jgi:hypothetical protein
MSRIRFHLSLALAGSLGLAACSNLTHVPPGQRLSPRFSKPAANDAGGAGAAPLLPPPPGTPAMPVLPEVQPALPSTPFPSNEVGNAYQEGNAAMLSGRRDEAIKQFEKAVKTDPNFGEAWMKLAKLYEETGQKQKALNAFRKAKNLPTIVAPNLPGELPNGDGGLIPDVNGGGQIAPALPPPNDATHLPLL